MQDVVNDSWDDRMLYIVYYARARNGIYWYAFLLIE